MAKVSPAKGPLGGAATIAATGVGHPVYSVDTGVLATEVNAEKCQQNNRILTTVDTGGQYSVD